MTELQDPIELYRASLAELPAREEAGPPTIRRAEAWPYPDLQRLWARVETGPFAAHPNLALTVKDPDGAVVCTMFMVEIREPYQSVTLHLRQPPRPGERYELAIALERDEQTLDVRTVAFDLVFREPGESSPQ